MGANSFGWNHVRNGVSITDKLFDIIEFWKNPKQRKDRKSIHAKYINENISLCGNCYMDSSDLEGWEKIEDFDSSVKSQVCLNCLRTIGMLQSSDTADNNVRQAKKTVSKASSSIAKKNKRLERYRKNLKKSKEDIEKTIKETQHNIVALPDEIGPEEHSLQNALNAASKLLGEIRKCACLNLDRTMKEWKEIPADSPQDIHIILQAKAIKDLIVAIDKLRAYPKQP
jgi:hypothetical protein